jgi:flavin-dependent dehydrogenase
MSTEYDAVVIGGGPGGATAALLLARAGWSVALLERKEFPRRKVCGEYLSATNYPLLERLGIAGDFREIAGPEVRRVGLFAGTTVTTAELPRPNGPTTSWGRALGREHLDTLLLAQAARAGVDVRQPWSAVALTKEGHLYSCQAKAQDTAARVTLSARVVIAAHGSWETGSLPTQTRRVPARASDLIAFKAHFRNSDLPTGLMPLLVFPGGYGGLVHCDDGRVSLSSCVRRDTLACLRRGVGGGAGEAVLEHIRASCRGVRQALAGAAREGEWLAAGPIRPGIRLRRLGGVFAVGNAAGEAHPAVAEGISMAMQSAWLLAARLIAWRAAGSVGDELPAVGTNYARAWRRSFAPRLYASAALAQWAMRPMAVTGALPLVRCFPPLLTWAARWSGKATTVVPRDRCVQEQSQAILSRT